MTVLVVAALAWLFALFVLLRWFRQNVHDEAPAPWTPLEANARHLGCLICRGDLERWEEWERCPRCALYYNPLLLETTPADVWLKIQDGHIACPECPRSDFGMPRVHVNSAGEPIPCPEHGKSP